MKTRALAVAGLFLAALPAVVLSQKPEPGTDPSNFGTISSYTSLYLKQAARNYTVALKSWNAGVVESAIAHSTFLRVGAPQLDLGNIRSALEDLAVSGNTQAIRYKAYLATVVFENPTSFEPALKTTFADDNQFFKVVAAQVHKTLLGYNAK